MSIIHHNSDIRNARHNPPNNVIRLMQQQIIFLVQPLELIKYLNKHVEQ